MTVPSIAIVAGRVLAGLTQTDLAKLAGLSRRTVAALETGRTVAAESVEAMINALSDVGVTVTDEGARIVIIRERKA